jgi:hypothetical protein
MTPEEIEEELRRNTVNQAAAQVALLYVLRAIANLSPDLRNAIAAGFDDAASLTESIALQGGEPTGTENAIEMLRIIEQLRAVAVGEHDKPKHGV